MLTAMPIIAGVERGGLSVVSVSVWVGGGVVVVAVGGDEEVVGGRLGVVVAARNVASGICVSTQENQRRVGSLDAM